MVTGKRFKRGMLKLSGFIQCVPPYHQVVMRIAEEEQRNTCDPKYGHTRVKWKWIPSSTIPDINKIEKPNSEAKELEITFSLFADDTSIIGKRRELDEGLQILKDVMESFEKRNNEDKEEKAVF